MPEHAGFAVAITIRERIFNDSLLLSYHAGNISHRLAAPIPDGPPAVFVDWFLQPPRVECTGNDPNRFTVHMSGWGPLSFVQNNIPRTRPVRWTMRLAVRARFAVEGTQIAFRPEPNDITLDLWQFEVLSGGPFPPDIDLYLRGGIFKNRLQSAVRTAISLGLLEVPPINADFLGPIIMASSMETGSRVVPGAVVVGLNIASDTVTTSGDAGLLADFARNNDIATVTNPVAVPLTMQAAEQQVRDRIAQEGATLERLTITAIEGKFRVEGRASRSEGAVNFSFHVLPLMFHSRPGALFQFTGLEPTPRVKTQTWAALDFRVADVVVDVDRAAWVVVLEIIGGILTAGFIPLLVEELVKSVVAQVTFATQSAQVSTPVPRIQHLPPLKAGDPSMRLEIAEFEIHGTGVFTGIRLTPKVVPPMVEGLTSIPRDLLGQPVRYRVQLPLDCLPDDPMLRLRWTILDLDTGTVLLNDDNVANGRLAIEFVPSSLGPNTTHFGIQCRIFRVLGASTTEILNDGLRLDVHAPLPPKTYVRWRYTVKNPQIGLHVPTDTWFFDGEAVVRRSSALHRLDKPCAMAHKRSRFAAPEDFFDEVPFPIRDILDRRATLCEYCFFGGPGKRRPSL